MSRACEKWLLALDLDGTLWDHHDVSSLTLPFRPLTLHHSFTSSEGVVVTVNRDVYELAMMAKEGCGIVASLSWNKPSHALAAIEALGLTSLFDYHGISTSPDKGRLLRSILDRVKAEHGVELPPCRIVYVDDRDIHLDYVVKAVGKVVYIRYGVVRGFENLLKKVVEGLAECSL